ncbi:hypothetical protein XELAEV_18014035mg [Xenopus laevis]|uniref:Uncharacterized protein n=1 Tax=Xenopus laevis TaxID=8355 RepID=A0A974DQX1_XENLA|nr:hypothetical protein XELAEV_18014035mg [Xenopus laevis]
MQMKKMYKMCKGCLKINCARLGFIICWPWELGRGGGPRPRYFTKLFQKSNLHFEETKPIDFNMASTIRHPETCNREATGLTFFI